MRELMVSQKSAAVMATRARFLADKRHKASVLSFAATDLLINNGCFWRVHACLGAPIDPEMLQVGGSSNATAGALATERPCRKARRDETGTSLFWVILPVLPNFLASFLKLYFFRPARFGAFLCAETTQ